MRVKNVWISPTKGRYKPFSKPQSGNCIKQFPLVKLFKRFSASRRNHPLKYLFPLFSGPFPVLKGWKWLFSGRKRVPRGEHGIGMFLTNSKNNTLLRFHLKRVWIVFCAPFRGRSPTDRWYAVIWPLNPTHNCLGPHSLLCIFISSTPIWWFNPRCSDKIFQIHGSWFPSKSYFLAVLWYFVDITFFTIWFYTFLFLSALKGEPKIALSLVIMSEKITKPLRDVSNFVQLLWSKLCFKRSS